MNSRFLPSIALSLPFILATPLTFAQEVGQDHAAHGHAHGESEREGGQDIRDLLPTANERLLFSMADSDQDGALSLAEVNAATERVFGAIDEDGDGQVTAEEIASFYGDFKQRQSGTHGHGGHGAHGEGSAASQAYMDAMEAMNREMATMEMTGDAAIDFVVMMIPHHQSAVDMAEAFLEHGDDPELTRLSREIIDAQEGEIEMMENWLRERGR